MNSQVDICNLALSHIAAKNITAMDEGREEARKCSLFWGPALEAALRSHDWNFAGQNEALAEISGETVMGYAYLYKYPANCLSVRSIYNESTDRKQKRTEDYKLLLSPSSQQRAIATDVELAQIEYTMALVDPSLFDSVFVMALSYQLAALLAKPLTGDTSLGSAMAAMAKAVVDEAKLANKQETKEETKKTSSYIDAR